VTSTEAYVAAIGALHETGDEDRAGALTDYVESRTWNPGFRCWDEGFHSDRVVLFANTWMANMLHDRGFGVKAMEALSLVGRLMFTGGPGEPFGMDGIGPIAVWYEGTLSYINAGGPGSNFLFRNFLPYINPDGSVPHYNDDLGGRAGIWAEKWASLDGTSWLYYTASRRSPFEPLERDTTCDPSATEVPGLVAREVQIYPNPAGTFVNFWLPGRSKGEITIRIRDVSGRISSNFELAGTDSGFRLELTGWKPGVYLVEILSGEGTRKGKFLKL